MSTITFQKNEVEVLEGRFANIRGHGISVIDKDGDPLSHDDKIYF